MKRVEFYDLINECVLGKYYLNDSQIKLLDELDDSGFLADYIEYNVKTDNEPQEWIDLTK